MVSIVDTTRLDGRATSSNVVAIADNARTAIALARLVSTRATSIVATGGCDLSACVGASSFMPMVKDAGGEDRLRNQEDGQEDEDLIFLEPFSTRERYLRGVTALPRPLLASPTMVGADARGDLVVEDLYAKHARYIAGVIHRILGGRDGEIDDIVQETFLDVFEGIARIDDPSAARSWLVTVAVRRTRRLLARRRRRALFAFWAKDYAPRASDPRDRQPVDDLYDALERIPEDVRIPWTLHRIEQLSLPETAAACEVSLATVKRRISDAEERLTRRLGCFAMRTPPHEAAMGTTTTNDTTGGAKR